jgi:hypothetical protein
MINRRLLWALSRLAPRTRVARRFAVAVTALTTVGVLATTAAPPAVHAASPPPTTHYRGAFYYQWYPEKWGGSGGIPGTGTNWTPTYGQYDSGDPATIARHVSSLLYGNFNLGIASWYGRGNTTDTRFPLMLNASHGTPLQWALEYEQWQSTPPTTAQMYWDAYYIKAKYASDPSYLKINGKPVLFVNNSNPNWGCSVVQQWAQAVQSLNVYLMMDWVANPGSCAYLPDGWYGFDPQKYVNRVGYSMTISPGFWKYGEPLTLPRSLSTWISNVQAMTATGLNWQLVTTFNDWLEGHAIESANQWASPSGYGQYLDVLHYIPRT